MKEYIRNVNVWVKEKNYELPVTDITPWGYDELVNHRIFETMDDLKFTMMALSRGGSKYALQHGLACPADIKNAIKHIESLSRY